MFCCLVLILLLSAACGAFLSRPLGRGTVTLPAGESVTFQFATPALLTVAADSLTTSAPLVARILSTAQKNQFETSHSAPNSVLAAATTARYRMFNVPIGFTTIVPPASTFSGDQFVVISNDNGFEITVAYNVKTTPIVAPSNGYAALVAGACGAFTVGPWPYAVTLVKIDTAAVHKVELEAMCTHDTGAPASQCPYEAFWLKQGDFNNITNPMQTGAFSLQKDLDLSPTQLKHSVSVNATEPSYLAFFVAEKSTAYAHVTYRIGTPGRADGCSCSAYGCTGLSCDGIFCDTPCTATGCRCDKSCTSNSGDACINGFCAPAPPSTVVAPATTASPTATTVKTTTEAPVEPPTRVPVAVDPTQSSAPGDSNGAPPSSEGGPTPDNNSVVGGSTSGANQGVNVCSPASEEQCASMCGTSDNVALCQCTEMGEFASSSCVNSSMSSPSLSNEIIIAIAVVASVLILVAGVVVVCALRRRKRGDDDHTHLHNPTARQAAMVNDINMHQTTSAQHFQAIASGGPQQQPYQPNQGQSPQPQQPQQQQQQQPPYARADFETHYTEPFKAVGAPMELGTLAPEHFSGGTMATGEIDQNALQPIIYSEVPRQSAVDNDLQRSNLIQSSSNWDDSVADL
jgi:hypothetical protein